MNKCHFTYNRSETLQTQHSTQAAAIVILIMNTRRGGQGLETGPVKTAFPSKIHSLPRSTAMVNVLVDQVKVNIVVVLCRGA